MLEMLKMEESDRPQGFYRVNRGGSSKYGEPFLKRLRSCGTASVTEERKTRRREVLRKEKLLKSFLSHKCIPVSYNRANCQQC